MNKINNIELSNLIDKANIIYNNNFPPITNFERAVFFSWGCTIGDCGFCYMSTQPKDKPPKETKRSMESIFAEFILSKNLGWDIGFFTGGIGVFKPDELKFMLKIINEIIGDKIWLSIGPLAKPILEGYKPYIKGVVGSTETINPVLHKKVCPSKPLKPYEMMFEYTGGFGLKKAMTFIVGMGENKEDLTLLIDFIKKYKIDKVHVYGLIPVKGTMFENYPIPSKEEQAWWIANLRVNFPKLDIQCGVWEDRVDRVSFLLKAGANSISKFRATKLFGTKIAEEIERQSESAGRQFKGTLTKLPDIDWKKDIERLSLSAESKKVVMHKLELYLSKMMANQMKKDKLIIIKSS